MDAPPDNRVMSPVYAVSHALMRSVGDMVFRGDTAGLENLPRTGGFLVASNHMSHLDPPVVGTRLAQQVAFFARKTLWKGGFSSWWLDAVGTIPVDRDGASDVSAIRRVLQALKEQRVVIVFPEGTRSPDGRLQSAKAGVGLLACKSAVPVVPARIFGSDRAFGREGKLRLGSPCSVVFGPVLAPADYDPGAGKERYQRAADRIMAAIARLELPAAAAV